MSEKLYKAIRITAIKTVQYSVLQNDTNNH